MNTLASAITTAPEQDLADLAAFLTLEFEMHTTEIDGTMFDASTGSVVAAMHVWARNCAITPKVGN